MHTIQIHLVFRCVNSTRLGKTLSLNEYLKVSKALNVNQILAKLTEATTDALFNLPTLVTAKAWSKVAPAYLYSFEYSGETKMRGSAFLTGLPLVSQEATNKEKVAHGDELIYLFDARDIYGASLPNQDVISGGSGRIHFVFAIFQFPLFSLFDCS